MESNNNDEELQSTSNGNEKMQIKTELPQKLMDEGERIKIINARKAEKARIRYHSMSVEEKKLLNQKRSEALRRRRDLERSLLNKPINCANSAEIGMFFVRVFSFYNFLIAWHFLLLKI